MTIVDAKFLQSAQSVNDSPAPNVAEVAFLGRSNVGKSSILNSLTSRNGLAKSSSTPGKTQLINYFEINFKTDNEELPYLYARFVDLPGYGYAKVSKSEKIRWAEMLEGYFKTGRNIRLVVQLIDMRHKPSADDLMMIEFLRSTGYPFVIVIRFVCTSLNLKNSFALYKLSNCIFIFSLTILL